MTLPTKYGEFRAIGYESVLDGGQHVGRVLQLHLAGARAGLEGTEPILDALVVDARDVGRVRRGRRAGGDRHGVDAPIIAGVS